MFLFSQILAALKTILYQTSVPIIDKKLQGNSNSKHLLTVLTFKSIELNERHAIFIHSI